jgi:hypothetical protein
MMPVEAISSLMTRAMPTEDRTMRRRKTMTEQEWNASSDSYAMLEACRMFVLSRPRKARFFAVTCCRRIRHLLVDERSRTAVEVVARYAEGVATDVDLQAAETIAAAAHDDAFRRSGKLRASGEWAVQFAACSQNAFFVATRAAEFAFIAVGERVSIGPEHAAQSDLIRCMFGPLPFRSIEIDPAWLTRNSGAVVKVAQKIYDEEAFDKMPILAEALEEASCTNLEMLAHCRQSSEHVRGCWVLDLLLGKE